MLLVGSTNAKVGSLQSIKILRDGGRALETGAVFTGNHYQHLIAIARAVIKSKT